MCGQITMCKCTKSYNKTAYFYLKTRLHSTFFTKIDLYNTIFQSLRSKIFKFGSFFFDHLEATFHANFYAYNQKPLFHSAETSFFQLIGTSLVEKGGFSLEKCKHKKKTKIENLFLMWHSFQQIKIKIIK